MNLGRFKYLVGVLSLAAAYSAYPAHAASDKAPECACVVPMTQAAGFAAAAEGAQLAPGSRVIVGANSTAALQVGPACALSLAQNSTATLLPQDRQLCVQVTTPQTRSVTLTSPEKSYGADPVVPLPQEPVPVVARSVPLWPLLFIPIGVCVALCFDDDDDPVSR